MSNEQLSKDQAVYAPRTQNKPKPLCRLLGHSWKPSHRKDEIRGQPVWVYIDDMCTRCYMTEWRMPDAKGQ
jgi:hypothetical protein